MRLERLRFPLVLLVLGLVSACTTDGSRPPQLDATVTLNPDPPVVGSSALAVVLRDADGQLLSGAEVEVEGNMNHAGMRPSFCQLEERAPGEYGGTLDFTMGGDWFLLITASTGGDVLRTRVDVRGVRAR